MAAALGKQVNQAVTATGGNLTMTGHSLGGGLADAAGMNANCPAVTFNAAGLNAFTVLADGYFSYSRRMVNYSVQGEILSSLQLYTIAPQPLATLYEFPPAAADESANPVQRHYMATVLHAMGYPNY